MKRLVTWLLVLALLCSAIPSAFAAGSNGVDSDANAAAQRLHQMGLLKGIGTNQDGTTNFDLESKLTREQAVTMLVRLMGKEEEALKGGRTMPFTDVSPWAVNYVAYAYEQKWTNGTGATTFAGTESVTAAHYITFVLRALGYSSETDFVWSSPWALSNAIGLTAGDYSSANNGDFIRADMAILSSNALNVKVKNSEKTLSEHVGLTVPSSARIKEEYVDRVLTDAQLSVLMNADLDTLREKISTIGDAVAYLDRYSPRSFSGFGDEIRLDIEFLFDLHTRPEATTPQTYAAFAAWCITDDYEGIKYVVMTGENYDCHRIGVALALPCKGGYQICTPSELSLLAERMGCEDVEISGLSGLEKVLQHSWSEPGWLQIFVADADQRTLKFSIDEDAMWAMVSSGDAELVYSMSDAEKAEREEQSKQQRIETGWKNLQNNWKDYGFPASFNPTLTKAQVEALIGKDADTVAAALKTLGDVIYYLALSGYYTTDGDMKVWENNLRWSLNEAPKTVFANNAGNCGGTAALVPFLLAGDYTESGCLTMTSAVEIGGGHVITYIQDGNICYVFDSRALVDTNYSWNGGLARGANVVEAGRKWRDTIDPTYKLIVAYPTADGDLPGMGDGKTVYLPEQYRDRIKIVYEATAEGYQFRWRAIGEAALEQMKMLRNPMTELPGSDVKIDKTGSYMTRVLTDEQLTKLKYADAKTLQAWISTVADAVAWLDQFGNHMYDAVSDQFETNVDFMVNLHRTEATAPSIYTVFTGWCLADDYPDTRYLVASGDNSDGSWIYYSLLLAEGSGFRVINPAEHSVRWNQVYGLQEMTVTSLDEIAKRASLVHKGMADSSGLVMYHLFAAEVGNKNLKFVLNGDFLIVSGQAEELFRLSEAAMQAMKEKEKAAWDAVAKDKKVSDYGMPEAIGKTTLNYQQAYALVGKDPEVIRASVKTVGDVLQYMIAARFGYDAPDVYTPWYGSWGFDAPGDVQLEQNYGCCCGGYANAVSYLLQGDYEKVGTLRWVGGGNHTISWVYTDGKYYVFDFTLYSSCGYYNYLIAPVTVLDDLADYYDKMPNCYPKSEVEILVAFEAGDAMYPSNWNDAPNFTGLTFPKEADGKVLTIYQRNPAYGVKYENVAIRIPGWNYGT